MRKVDLDYPFGVVEVPLGWEVIIAPAACSQCLEAGPQEGHPLCDPAAYTEGVEVVRALGGREVLAPVLTSAGWKAVWVAPGEVVYIRLPAGWKIWEEA